MNLKVTRSLSLVLPVVLISFGMTTVLFTWCPITARQGIWITGIGIALLVIASLFNHTLRENPSNSQVWPRTWRIPRVDRKHSNSLDFQDHKDPPQRFPPQSFVSCQGSGLNSNTENAKIRSVQYQVISLNTALLTLWRITASLSRLSAYANIYGIPQAMKITSKSVLCRSIGSVGLHLMHFLLLAWNLHFESMTLGSGQNSEFIQVLVLLCHHTDQISYRNMACSFSTWLYGTSGTVHL